MRDIAHNLLLDKPLQEEANFVGKIAFSTTKNLLGYAKSRWDTAFRRTTELERFSEKSVHTGITRKNPHFHECERRELLCGNATLLL